MVHSTVFKVYCDNASSDLKVSTNPYEVTCVDCIYAAHERHKKFHQPLTRKERYMFIVFVSALIYGIFLVFTT